MMLHVSTPDLSDLELEYVVEAVRSTWISSSGAFLDRFESEFANACDVPHALGTSNGTVALHLALAALGIGAGDEVIVPSLTYIATANAVTYVGATPVFADVSAETWCIDPDHVRALLTPRTAAVIAVHLYGHPADMTTLRALTESAGIPLVEDAAEAPFATERGQSVGSLGTVATFSFYGNKVITSGEGGAVMTSDEQLAARMRQLRGQGVDPERRYFFPVVGFNYRMTNIAAALLCAQLERRVGILERRNRLYRLYDVGLADLAEVQRQPIAPWARCAPWMYSITIAPDSSVTRDELMRLLGEAGVETRPFFVPVHSLPPYVAGWRRHPTDLPVTDDLGMRGLNLPTSSTYGADEADRVVSSIRAILAR